MTRRMILPASAALLLMSSACADDSTNSTSLTSLGNEEGITTTGEEAPETGEAEAEGDGDPGDGDGDGDPGDGDGDGDPTGDGDGDPTGDGDGDPTGDGDGDPTGDGDGAPCGAVCCPGESQCNGDVSEQCNEDGSAWAPKEVCDPVQGSSCNENFGTCEGPCSAGALGLTYIGCDYYPTVTQQLDSYVGGQNQFAVTVSNVSAVAANVTITRGAMAITNTVVQPGAVTVIPLPWVQQLWSGTGPTVLVQDGAYRLRSDQPVVVYQYNPINATVTNDASILLPVNAWGPEVVVASWYYWGGFYNYPGFYSVVASEDNTTVELFPSATGGNVQAGGGVAANGTGVVVLNNSDVLQVVNSAGDLTGTLIVADKPIQVFGGHECSNVPLNIVACDHLEESIFPLQTLSNEYFVVPPVQVPNFNALKATIVRVIATEDNTQITFQPDQGQNQVLANRGDFLEIPMTTNAFKVTGDKNILAVQYMVGQAAGYGTSDPAMLLAVPIAQYRTNYLFYAEPNWTANFVDIIAQNNAMVTVDGGAVNNWTPIGATGYSVAHVQLSNNGNGRHEVNSNSKVGISVYGVLNYGSYWYPGGLDLTINPQ